METRIREEDRKMDDRKIKGKGKCRVGRVKRVPPFLAHFPIPEGCQRLDGGCGAIATPPPVARSDAHFDPEGVVARPGCDPFGVVDFFDPYTPGALRDLGLIAVTPSGYIPKRQSTMVL